MHRLFSLPLTLFFFVFALSATAPAQDVELLDFTSDSCPACRQMEPVLQDLAASGFAIRPVDVSRERDLAARYQIEYLPTFVAVADGREIDRQVGVAPPDRLRAMLRRARAAASPPRQEPSAQTQERFPASPTASSGPTHLEARLIASSVRLRVEDAQGISYGTGTIIFAQHGEAIVLTCGHIFRESQGRTPVQVELFEAAGTPRVADVVDGEVLGYDLTRDLGLVRIRAARPICAASLAATSFWESLQPGNKAISVGCNHGKEPTVWHTRLTAINRYVGPANVEASRTPVQGRSGGGLFNERGELIGVCFAADDQGNEGLYVGLPAIYDELDRLQLTSIATPPNPAALAMDRPSAGGDGRGLQSRAPQAGGTAPRGLVPAPSGDRVLASAESKTLTSEELAALEEIGQRSRGSEVIVIIRPKSPGDRCEILSLQNPSREFIGQLTALGNEATIPRFTSQKQMRQPAAAQASGRSPQALHRTNAANTRGTTKWTAVPSSQRRR